MVGFWRCKQARAKCGSFERHSASCEIDAGKDGSARLAAYDAGWISWAGAGIGGVATHRVGDAAAACARKWVLYEGRTYCLLGASTFPDHQRNFPCSDSNAWRRNATIPALLSQFHAR
jgi:hypothetical protein